MYLPNTLVFASDHSLPLQPCGPFSLLTHSEKNIQTSFFHTNFYNFRVKNTLFLKLSLFHSNFVILAFLFSFIVLFSWLPLLAGTRTVDHLYHRLLQDLEILTSKTKRYLFSLRKIVKTGSAVQGLLLTTQTSAANTLSLNAI